MYNIADQEYQIKFVDRILDPVHGFIDLTSVERDIINLPIFKRTQNLKQLSLTNWVFPGAEHTRYIHSLGVMYIANLMAQNLYDESGKPFFTDSELQLLRIAALLHDIGHYPLSHVIETVYKEYVDDSTGSISSYNKNTKKQIDKITGSNNTDYMKSSYSKPYHHETMGTKVIKNDADINKIISTYCSFIDIDYVCDIIVGCVEHIDEYPKLSVMVQLIHSELDADGIDYVLRDATFSGTSYGSFELGLLLRNLTVSKYKDTYILGIKPKGICVVDQFLLSKYFSYVQVVFNRHVAIYDKMAEMIAETFCKEKIGDFLQPKILNNFVEQHCEQDYYLKFTDNFFWSKIADSDIAKLRTKEIKEYNLSIIKCLSHYQEFEVEKETIFNITSSNPKDVYSKICETSIYQSLDSEDESHIALFHQRRFTTELKEKQFNEILDSLGTKVDSSEYIKTNTARLQEGVAVIDEKDGSLHLLIDDPCSIMNHMGNSATYILRNYKVPTV